MKARFLPIVLALVVVAVISAASSWLTIRILNHDTTDISADYHQWIHDQLNLTEDQERRLAGSEQRYEEARRHCEKLIAIANVELAEAIRRDQIYSPAVERSVSEIHDAMGQLQRATLKHIFEMKEVLDPDQYERLMDLTEEALEAQAGEK